MMFIVKNYFEEEAFDYRTYMEGLEEYAELQEKFHKLGYYAYDKKIL